MAYSGALLGRAQRDLLTSAELASNKSATTAPSAGALSGTPGTSGSFNQSNGNAPAKTKLHSTQTRPLLTFAQMVNGPREAFLTTGGGGGTSAPAQEKKVIKKTAATPAPAVLKTPLGQSWTAVQKVDHEAFQKHLEARIFDQESWVGTWDRDAFRAVLRSQGPELLRVIGEAVTG